MRGGVEGVEGVAEEPLPFRMCVRRCSGGGMHLKWSLGWESLGWGSLG